MEYKLLTDAQLTEVRRQKLVQIEAEYAALALDLELAATINLTSEQVAQGKANLALLDHQHQALCELMWPPAAEPSDNGATAPVAATA